jgi:hypothetical protein
VGEVGTRRWVGGAGRWVRGMGRVVCAAWAKPVPEQVSGCE